MNGTGSIIRNGGGVTGKPSIVSNGQNKAHDSQNNSSDAMGADISFPVPSRGFAAKQEGKRLNDVYKMLKKYVDEKKLDSKVMVVKTERGVVITLLTDKMLFKSGQAELLPDEMPLLQTISGILSSKLDNPVHVEGHTDDLAISTGRFPSNWELSVIRATTVLRYLETHHVAAARLEASGYADQRPIASNDTDSGRRRNRRVEIVIVPRFTAQEDRVAFDRIL